MTPTTRAPTCKNCGRTKFWFVSRGEYSRYATIKCQHCKHEQQSYAQAAFSFEDVPEELLTNTKPSRSNNDSAIRFSRLLPEETNGPAECRRTSTEPNTTSRGAGRAYGALSAAIEPSQDCTLRFLVFLGEVLQMNDKTRERKPSTNGHDDDLGSQVRHNSRRIDRAFFAVQVVAAVAGLFLAFLAAILQLIEWLS